MSGTRIAEPVFDEAGLALPVLPIDDYQLIMGTVACYGRMYDDDRIDDFMSLIAPDALFRPNWPGVAPDTVEGADNLRPFFTEARAACHSQNMQPRHYTTNVVITSYDGETAGVSANMLYTEFTEEGGAQLKMVGQYDFRLRKDEGRWRIAEWSMRYDKAA
ncbi:hypothetical protein GCM10011371_00270 [Novosphingobium marinum]|uniref:Ketosteroid isomerase-like protein n=1 Tax=Novosphingobium marinum TaxID=1514948 RepID=A0A7Y9XSF7_9SPHN|nr:nuclear transport factor 2 family protein [Novosphingobium marinum]NYH93719.1 ketosteroid isomerase-like protein [Novosphingobium marinum]GGC16787.1 hypothetical protein GCM10011371_00270 [Novosphingobium marinum]